ncbi:MAG: hypothetical protein HC935_04525 [Pseudanabaena sp. SU_2_4]|nr:hypothetical protein [Pseudanabaena sp. SU_2_4]
MKNQRGKSWNHALLSQLGLIVFLSCSFFIANVFTNGSGEVIAQVVIQEMAPAVAQAAIKAQLIKKAGNSTKPKIMKGQ